jgi:FkbM family methyltransferase
MQRVARRGARWKISGCITFSKPGAAAGAISVLDLRSLRAGLGRLRHRLKEGARISYAQCGEDLIIQYVFSALGRQAIRYLDIGAHHPSYLSNTYYFYTRGHRGVCVEPDASLLGAFRKDRPDDTLLSIGIAAQEGQADFFVMTTPTLNTFSRAEAERFASYGKQKIERVEQVRIRNINDVMVENFGGAPDLLSLDVEGLDLEILHSLDFDRHAPDVCCVETLSYTEDRTERKLTEIIDLMLAHGYFVYADTYVNSIFVRRSTWRERTGAR